MGSKTTGPKPTGSVAQVWQNPSGNGLNKDMMGPVINTGQQAPTGPRGGFISDSIAQTLGQINPGQGVQPAIPNVYGPNGERTDGPTHQDNVKFAMEKMYGQHMGLLGQDGQAPVAPSPAMTPQAIPNLHMPNLNRQQVAPDYRQMRIDQILGRLGRSRGGGY